MIIKLNLKLFGLVIIYLVIGSFPYNKALERLRAFNNENKNRELYNRPYSNKKFDDVSYLNANKERYPSLYLYSILKKKNVSIPRAGKRHFNTDEEIFGSIEKKNIYMPRVGRRYDWLTGV